MNLKYLLIPLGILLVIVIIWLIPRTETHPPAYAFPDEMSILLKDHYTAENVEHFSSNFLSPIIGEQNELNEADSQFRAIVRKISEEEAFADLLDEQPGYVSFHATASTRFDPLLVLDKGHFISSHSIEELLEENFGKLRISQRTFRESPIYDVRDADHDPVFSYSTPDNLLIVSTNTVLVEDALRALRQNQEELSPIIENIKNAEEENFFLHTDGLAGIANTIIDREGQLPSDNEALLGNLMSSTNIRLQNQGFTFSGNTQPYEGPSDFLRSLQPENAEEQTLPGDLPDRTGYYTAFRVEDYQDWQSRWLDLRQENDRDIEREDLEKMGNLLGDQWATALYEPPSPSYESRLFTAAYLADDAHPEELIDANEEILDDRAYQKESRDYRGHTLKRFAFREGQKELFSPFAPGFEEPWFAIYEDLLILAPAPSHLERILRDLENGNTLDNLGRYRSYQDQMLSEANLSMYFNPRRLSQFPPAYLRERPEGLYRENTQIFQRFRHSGIQLAAGSDGFYTRGFAEMSPDIEQRSEILWASPIERPVQKGPFIVENHENENLEILSQDEENNLYLLGPSGEEQWSRSLPGPIQGSVEQIDLYDNNRLQYLFATEEYVHLIDRNGDYVANYPISLAQPTEHGLTLYDIPGDRAYRYFIPTEGNNIYGFHEDGRPVSGWGPRDIRGDAEGPVQYILYQGTAHVLTHTDEGFLHLINLMGEDIKGPFNIDEVLTTRLFANIGDEKENTYIFGGDSTGHIHRFNLEGDRDTMRFAELNMPYHLNVLDYTDNDEQEYIFTHESVMEVYGQDSSRIRRHNLSDQPVHRPEFFEHDGEQAFGYVESQTGQVYLHDYGGNIFHGFPVDGDRPIKWGDLNRDGYQEMITASGNDIRVYRVR